MYLNIYQKYILELLREYGGLLKRQLEFMVKRFKEPHLLNIDGYIYQLKRFERIYCTDYMGEEAVILPGREIDDNIIIAFDIMLQFSDYIAGHEKACSPVTMRFFISPDNNSMQEINIVPVAYDKEIEVVHYAEGYMIDIAENAEKISHPPAWIFLIHDKRQMKQITPKVEYSFVVMKNGKPVFYEGH